MYTLIAWLPETENFIAKNEQGEIGYLSPRGWRLGTPNTLHAAVSKYWYEEIPTPIKVESVDELANASETLLKLNT
jgi:hypothetical protein